MNANIELKKQHVHDSAATIGGPLTDQPEYIFEKEELQREVTLGEIKEILAKTIVHDDVSKVMTFLAAMLTYTKEDQVNVAFKAESSTGKSYIVKEVLKYFPKEDTVYTAYSSPTAFYHEDGILYDRDGNRINLTQEPKANDPVELKKAWKERLRNSRKVIDWEQKIIVFLDQPHNDLLERLRPLLSHDMKLLPYRVTDKTGQFGLKTKTTYVKGYPTVFFCSAKMNMKDQERTRLFLLSPEATSDKIEDAVRLSSSRISDRDKFQKSLESDRDRQWLIQRICLIKEAKIENIVIPNAEEVVNLFFKQHRKLAPRAQRDFPRLMSLIKAHAVLNCFKRERAAMNIITANQTDINAGFKWYTEIVQSNELGLAPETYDFYKKIFEGEELGLTKEEILRKYYTIYHRTLNIQRLERDILLALKSAGVIMEERDLSDGRIKRYIPFKGGAKVSSKMDTYEGFIQPDKDDPTE